MIRKFLLLTAFLFCFINILKAQTQNGPAYLVKGIITDSVSRKPAEFATIGILDSEKKVVALTYSDENGLFKSADIKAGSYFLNLSFMGYAQKNLAFNISSKSPVFDAGNIYLKPEVTQLNAVNVTGTRALVEQQPGMLVYNAEKDISNQGGTAADVLRKAPVLNVDAAGNVTMRGNSNLRILINGKYSGQMARSAADALNMMPANSIKAVEVITSPSARYDAEGAAGVINIITKKGQQNVSGTVEVVAGNLEQALNPRLSISREKWNINTTLHAHSFRNREETTLNRLTFENGEKTGRVQQHIVRDNTKPHGSGDVQIEFAPDSASIFNFSVNGWFGKWPDNSAQHNQRFSANETLLEDFRQNVITRSPTLGVDLNLGYTKKFRKPGEELYIMGQHNRSSDGFNYDAMQRDPDNALLYREINDNKNLNREWTVQTDYIFPFGNGYKNAWESGAKMILRENSSDYQVAASGDSNPGQLVPVSSRTDFFSYTQNVFAGYSQLKFKWQNGWALHAGARMEGTYLEGNQRNQNSTFKNDFWNFVPSATLFKKLNANNNLTLSYTKRISRPSIWDLNPNVNAQDPKNLEIGNPNLRPEQVNQVEFTYALQTDSDFFLNASLFSRETTNSIESIVSIGPGGITTTSKQNLASNIQYGLNLSTSVSVMPGWKINSNANVRRARYRSGALNILNEGWAWGLNVNSSWKLPDNFSVQAYANYDGRNVKLQGFESYWFYYSFSAKKELPAQKLTISLTTVSPFGGYIGQTVVTRAADFESTLASRYLMRSVRLSLNWEFGSMFKTVKSRKVENDDQKNVKSAG
ncbi:outer membrane beta-barrel family protein [Dyadobacter chenhuakuii]|uniref:TonB-dependent receptor family protein n=1 Tax=Dyadobacter chenhuakuii TaxID=2909339 RepID=A0A9X1QBX3_9BACT|nr:outer membrane beta-barrel family protein [Dyadobacter chenhuakuii]MCF2498988.1 TonB-dependent receptor family protein [Dyadobacter chenhuakuii]